MDKEEEQKKVKMEEKKLLEVEQKSERKRIQEQNVQAKMKQKDQSL